MSGPVVQHKCTIVHRGSKFDTDDDKTSKEVTNPWKWSWMEYTVNCDGHVQRLGDTIRKLTKVGTAMCVLCDKEIKYGSRGRIALVQHVSKDNHQKVLKMRKNNSLLPG